MLFNSRAEFPLAVTLRRSSAPIGEVFSFLSGLYFRGKLAYAQAFHRTRRGGTGVFVITPGTGLVPPDRKVTLEELKDIATVGVSLDEPRYHEPFARDVGALADRLGKKDTVVLLGSIATDKYVKVLENPLARRLHFPSEFIGRGDMSRGGLMLRCVAERRELSYVPIDGAVRHGSRPPKLEPKRKSLRA
jgi:hypothetical protein